MSEWIFITKHGLVLACIAKHPGKTAREIGDDVGVTERTAHKMIIDLVRDGYLTKAKAGNKNTYKLHPDVPLKAGDAAIGELLELLGWKRRKRRKTAETSKKND